MHRWAWMLCCGVVCAALAACAAVPTGLPPEAQALLRDDAFRAPREQPDASTLFTLSAPMQALVAEQLTVRRGGGDPRRALIEQLYRRDRLALEYDGARTRTAAEAYAARAGNCLSLAVMTAAFAKALNMPVSFQQVDLPEHWTRSGGLAFGSVHLNVALALPPTGGGHWLRTPEPAWVVDFVPADELRGRPVRLLSERTVAAMYLNNRAAESLAAGDADTAYWWAREALLHASDYAAAWNTLGVVYLQQGLVPDAERVFMAVLEREPGNAKALDNLVAAQSRGPVALRPEASRAERHYRVARAELARGNLEAGRRHLEQAREASATPAEREIYTAKLDWLSRLR